MSDTSPEILEQLRALLPKAYVRYSNYPVAAIIRSNTGKFYQGVNVENAAYPMTRCAEQSAVQSMVTAGEQVIAEVWIMTFKAPVGTPCGGCRQVLSEFAKPDVPVHCYSAQSDEEIHSTIGELLPRAFGPNYL